MINETKVLLITGPAASGKSTFAKYIADKLGWPCISEDAYWVHNGWSGLRTEDQEHMVQKQVSDNLFSALNKNKGVVLEFILYKKPPNPLTNYQKFLSDNSIPFETIVLKPTIDEIKKRLLKRGRPNDIENIEGRMKDATNQLSILDAGSIDLKWIIDPTNLAIEELYAKYLRRRIDS